MADAPHNNNILGYKVFHPTIKQVLRKRSLLDSTIQLAAPFVKVTATIEQPDYLGPGNIGFTLGPHVFPKDIEYEDLYSGRVGNNEYSPLVGYTYTDNGTNQPVYAQLPPVGVQEINMFLDRGEVPYTYPEKQFVRIPPPGIQQATIGRNNNGLISSTQLKITIPSLVQLEMLHRVFLIPNMGMIVEWGQQFAPHETPFVGQDGITDSTIETNMFPWYSRLKLDQLLDKIAYRELGIQQILDDYVYPTEGQYMWMFGRVSSFTVNGTSDGSYDVNMKIVGPSEDSWAYSTKRTIVSGITRDGNFCARDVNTIKEYFDSKVDAGFGKLLTTFYNKNPEDDWRSHVQRFGRDDEQPGSPKPYSGNAQSNQNNPDQDLFKNIPESYYITWRFFVNVVLNGIVGNDRNQEPIDGSIKKMFKNKLSEEQYRAITLLRPYIVPNLTESIAKTTVLDDPLESRVGANFFLRSIDVSKLILNNPIDDRNDNNRLLTDALKAEYNRTDSNFPLNRGNIPRHTGHFLGPAKNVYRNDSGKYDFGFLSSGVWLNHKLIIEQMSKAETFLEGIINLLREISNATGNYWSLMLDPVEPTVTSNEQHSWTVVDINYRGNSNSAVELALGVGTQDELQSPNRLYTFNKFVRKIGSELVGSELLESNIDLSLPKQLFAQIAVGGLTRPEDIERFRNGRISGTSAVVSEPNETQRYMFSLASISPQQLRSGKGIDRTIPAFGENNTGTCTGQNNFQYGPPGSNTITNNMIFNGQLRLRTGEQPTADGLQRAQEMLNKTLREISYCQSCNNCTPPATAGVATTQGITSVTALPIANINTSYMNQIKTNGNRSRTEMVVIHHTGGSTQDPNRIIEVLNTSERVNPRTQQLEKVRLGYHYLVAENGTIYQLAPDDSIVSHAGELNSSTISISLMSLDDKYYTPVQIQAAVSLARALQTKYGLPKTAVRGHSKGGSIPANDPKLGRYHRPGPFVKEGDGIAELVKTSTEPVRNMLDLIRPAPAVAAPSSQERTESIGLVNNESKQCLSKTLPVLVKIPAGALSAEKTEEADADIKKLYPNGPPATEETYKRTRMGIDSLAADYKILSSKDVMEKCKSCFEDKILLDEINRRLDNEGITRQKQFVSEHPNLSGVFVYQENYASYMYSLIRGTANDSSSNAMGTAPGSLSLSAKLVLPGINGIRAGELFWIDRIPMFYKIFGAFQVLSVEDTIDVGGWKTTISARFNYLGREWRESVLGLLRNQGIDI